MELIIVIGVGVVVVVAVVALVVRGARSRSARSDWLGELSEIRRSSLGDDEEVTGALEAVSIDEDPPGEATPAAEEEAGEQDPDPSPVPTPSPATPLRTITDAGTLFDEYEWPGFATLRVDATDPRGLRVLADDGSSSRRIVVDLRRGVLWFRNTSDGAPTDGSASCSARIPGGWVVADADLLVLADPTGWSYVMCLRGTLTIRLDTSGDRVGLTAGQVGRVRAGTADHDVVDVGVSAILSEDVVRRQRRLDHAHETRPMP